MHVVIKKRCAWGGQQWNPGDIIDIARGQFDKTLMEASGLFQFPKSNREHAVEVLEGLQGYLCEKGVEYIIGSTVTLGTDIERTVVREQHYDPTGAISLLLVDVPKRMYHEVVVPGLIHYCKSRGLRFQARNYKRLGSKRSLELQLRWETEEVRDIMSKVKLAP